MREGPNGDATGIGEQRPRALLAWIDRIVMAPAIDALGLASGVIIAAMTLGIGADVVVRALALRPLGWTLEMSEYGLLVVCFGGAPWVLRHADHIRVDVVLRGASSRVRYGLLAVANVLAGLTCLALAWFGAGEAWSAFERGAILRKAIDVPQGAVLAMMPLGMVLLAWEFARRISPSATRPDPGPEDGVHGGSPAL